MDEDVLEVAYLPAPIPPSPQFPDSYENYRGRGTPLIIDNGATTLRFGFCTSDSPKFGPNIISKYKDRKSNKPLVLFGDAVDTEPGARNQAKTPWEGDILLNFDALENALDYAFVQLGIDTPNVDHPVMMTERLSSNLHSRALTSELMFELYSVPSLVYCVDSVMSFYHNNKPPHGQFTADGLVISFNTASTSVIPILNGKGILSNAKRIPWGSSQVTEYLLKLIQLKYPTFPTRVTSPQANWMLQNFCEFSSDYPALLRSLSDPVALARLGKIIQFPFSQPTVDEKTEEEQARLAEKRKEQGKRLQEMAAKVRMEKLEAKEKDLREMLELRDRKVQTNELEYFHMLHAEGFEGDGALDFAIKKLEASLKKSKKKDGDEEPASLAKTSIPNTYTLHQDEPAIFPLVDVPDAELDEDQLKEKRKQKLLKAGWEARMKARNEKQREKEEREADERRETEDRERDLTAWASGLRKHQEAIINRIKDRARRKAALSDRKSAAAQARMKKIASLANDERVPKKRKKGNGDDMFGADDADWAIYRKINTTEKSSDEEEELQQLQTIEQKLLTHDPAFTIEDTHAYISTKRSALISAFKPVYDEGDPAGKTRIHLNTERWRVCETWFSPSMAGVDSAGIGEVVQNILAAFSAAERARLTQAVFLTGGPSQLPGLAGKTEAALRPILPPDVPLRIVKALDPSTDGWRGMADFSQTDEFARVGITKADYDEWGGERIKKWWGGNWNMAV
ncbi:chromatin remodeling complex subunit [Thelephora terrestris]|uniref:Chromatin remodeling complex subunit n=1 Tax=Thelephora terrestris TaxID=56493 RepID=A0A9P6HF33_9AGAM|nr:chromatin remodeling complex subunit [Thelephora terrestris]